MNTVPKGLQDDSRAARLARKRAVVIQALIVSRRLRAYARARTPAGHARNPVR